MRNEFAKELLELMYAYKGIQVSGWQKWKNLDRQKYDGVALVLGDVGYGVFDKVKMSFPGWVINCGAAEHSMLGIAVGLSMEKRLITFVYTITPFLLWRGAEVIRNYIHHEKIPVKLIGSGRDQEYEHDGFSHVCTEDVDLFSKIFYNIKTYRPETKEDIPAMVQEMATNNLPCYLNLKRGS
jgi:transketolase